MYTFALASAVLASTVAANSLYSRQSTCAFLSSTNLLSPRARVLTHFLDASLPGPAAKGTSAECVD